MPRSVDEFLSNHPRSTWATGEPTLAFPELKEYLAKYQDPQQADSILKIQKELDETKIVLHKTIESVLQRGEKIDDLVAKSDGLSAQSKMFYRRSSFLWKPDVFPRLQSLHGANAQSCRASEEAELMLHRDVKMAKSQCTSFLFLYEAETGSCAVPLGRRHLLCL